MARNLALPVFALVFCGLSGWGYVQANFTTSAPQTLNEAFTRASNALSPMVTPALAVTPPKPAPVTYRDLPDAERTLIGIVSDFATSYQAAANDMAAGAFRPRRAHAICQALPHLTAVDWAGTVETLASDNDGDGVLGVRLSPTASVTTNPTSLSDTTAHTLLTEGSHLHETALNLQVGQHVTFSGTFFPSKSDCLDEMSLTVSGDMTDPSFVFRFTGLRAE